MHRLHCFCPLLPVGSDGETVQCWTLKILKGYIMDTKTIIVCAWAVILQMLALILFAVANAWIDPSALIVLVPITLMAICQIWFGDGQL